MNPNLDYALAEYKTSDGDMHCVQLPLIPIYDPPRSLQVEIQCANRENAQRLAEALRALSIGIHTSSRDGLPPWEEENADV